MLLTLPVAALGEATSRYCCGNWPGRFRRPTVAGQCNPLQCANLGLRRLLLQLQHGRPNQRADHQNNTADLRQR